MILERRSYELKEIEGGTDENGPTKLVGYAAVFNQLSEPIGGFIERIESGAFSESIKSDDIRALFNHDSNYPLGRTKNGTMVLTEDEHGLRVEIEPPDTSFARDLMINIKRGDVTQMSFGFYVKKDEWETVDDTTVRTLREVELFDVSPVTFPAYTGTEIQAREQVIAEARAHNRIPPVQGDGKDDTNITDDQRMQGRRAARRRTLELLKRKYGEVYDHD